MDQMLPRPVRIPVRRGAGRMGQRVSAGAGPMAHETLRDATNAALTSRGWKLVALTEQSRVYWRSRSIAAKPADEELVA